MAGWNDLPTELKRVVVGFLDEEERVKTGEATSRSKERQALLALSSTDRELHALASPVLWHTLELRHSYLSRCTSFANKIGPSKGHLVRQLLLHRASIDLDELSSSSTIEAAAGVLSRVLSIDSLTVSSDSATVLQPLLPLLTMALRSPLRSLCLRSDYDVAFNIEAAVALIYAFPGLENLECLLVRGDDEDEEEEQDALVQAFRSATALRHFRFDSADTCLQPSLAQPRSSSLTALELGDLLDEIVDDVPLLITLLNQHATTLRRLQLPYYVSSQPFPPFTLPHLRDLSIFVNGRALTLPLSFAASPLKRLEIGMYGVKDPREPFFRSLLEGVDQHASTLETVRITHYEPKWFAEEDEADLDELKAWCVKHGVVYEVGVVQ